MKRLEVTTVINECSDCPYANIWANYCSKYKRYFPERDETLRYTIPEWCELDNLKDEEEFIPELVNCKYIDSHCSGCICVCADHETSKIMENPSGVRFRCKRYNIWLMR